MSAPGVTADRVELPGGTFRMGSDRFHAEEGPVVEVGVAPFGLDRTAVTNADFAAFVAVTGYVTVAERPVDPPLGADGAPGSLVFTPTPGPVDLRDWRQWWRWVPGASWRHPEGPGSDTGDRADHPVVHIAAEDAEAYAAWVGGRLPSEPEWEFACRGGLDQAAFTWGDEPPERAADGTRVNSWQGAFPWRNNGAGSGRWTGTAPVGSFPPNGWGLHEMTGNTWEWTSSPWTERHHAVPADRSLRVIKGGSHLCSPDYCLRIRPAARSAQDADSAATHLGFRVAYDARP